MGGLLRKESYLYRKNGFLLKGSRLKGQFGLKYREFSPFLPLMDKKIIADIIKRVVRKLKNPNKSNNNYSYIIVYYCSLRKVES